MKYSIGISGSAAGNISSETTKKAYIIGQEIAKAGITLVTGATTGLSFESAKGAKDNGGLVIGVSPSINKQTHDQLYKSAIKNKEFDYKYFDYILYTGFERKGRNVLFIRGCDGIICIGGRIGTLNEFTIAYDEGKPIGVLKSGGITDLLPKIVKTANKGSTKVIYDSNPKKLVIKLIDILKYL